MKHTNQRVTLNCLLLAGLIFIAAVNPVMAMEDQTCLSCHHEKNGKSTRHISREQFESSVHGRDLSCQECHTGVVDAEHQTLPGSGAVDCRQCHEVVNHHGVSSTDRQRPTCYSCHTRHGILPADNPISSVHKTRLADTCSQCHPAACGKTDFLSWLPARGIVSHYKADAASDYGKYDCIGCHQGQAVHGQSGKINDDTCQKCHMDSDGKNALMGVMHPRAHAVEQSAVFTSAMIYQIFVVVLILGGMRFYIRKRSRKSKK